MKVRQAIRQLQNLDPEAELLVFGDYPEAEDFEAEADDWDTGWDTAAANEDEYDCCWNEDECTCGVGTQQAEPAPRNEWH